MKTSPSHPAPHPRPGSAWSGRPRQRDSQPGRGRRAPRAARAPPAAPAARTFLSADILERSEFSRRRATCFVARPSIRTASRQSAGPPPPPPPRVPPRSSPAHARSPPPAPAHWAPRRPGALGASRRAEAPGKGQASAGSPGSAEHGVRGSFRPTAPPPLPARRPRPGCHLWRGSPGAGGGGSLQQVQLARSPTVPARLRGRCQGDRKVARVPPGAVPRIRRTDPALAASGDVDGGSRAVQGPSVRRWRCPKHEPLPPGPLGPRRCPAGAGRRPLLRPRSSSSPPVCPEQSAPHPRPGSAGSGKHRRRGTQAPRGTRPPRSPRPVTPAAPGPCPRPARGPYLPQRRHPRALGVQQAQGDRAHGPSIRRAGRQSGGPRSSAVHAGSPPPAPAHWSTGRPRTLGAGLSAEAPGEGPHPHRGAQAAPRPAVRGSFRPTAPPPPPPPPRAPPRSSPAHARSPPPAPAHWAPRRPGALGAGRRAEAPGEGPGKCGEPRQRRAPSSGVPSAPPLPRPCRRAGPAPDATCGAGPLALEAAVACSKCSSPAAPRSQRRLRGRCQGDTKVARVPPGAVPRIRRTDPALAASGDEDGGSRAVQGPSVRRSRCPKHEPLPPGPLGPRRCRAGAGRRPLLRHRSSCNPPVCPAQPARHPRRGSAGSGKHRRRGTQAPRGTRPPRSPRPVAPAARGPCLRPPAAPAARTFLSADILGRSRFSRRRATCFVARLSAGSAGRQSGGPRSSPVHAGSPSLAPAHWGLTG
ncbi:basic proline-rich protein-like [Canis lupus familiaris]|uniref:basic proline-rich protein-like n=1 Tax=Canis lupus familiaris TaxID=9615 RepID=UPI0018F2CA81|nr:basic proline-rich protein-like [Canis lupus familiaris]